MNSFDKLLTEISWLYDKGYPDFSIKEDREELYQALGVKDMEGFNKFVEDTMFKIGRPL